MDRVSDLQEVVRALATPLFRPRQGKLGAHELLLEILLSRQGLA